MYNYYRYSPRGFANEDTIYAANMSSPAHKALIERLEQSAGHDDSSWIMKITAKEAMRITAANRRAYRIGEASCCNPAGACEITYLDALEAAI